MDILDKIIARKTIEVAERKNKVTSKQLETTLLFPRETISLKSELLNPLSSGIIAEHKRKSPSKGIINADVTLAQVTTGYTKAGASGLSVLTDIDFFGGSDQDLIYARTLNQIPILRKDFIIDEYQLIEAKAFGADVILLIAACLTPKRLRELAVFAKSLGLDVLMEVHNLEELQQNLIPELDIVGVNNRNLKTFEVTLQTSIDLYDYIPADYVKITESGINTAKEMGMLYKIGYRGFLIGESMMKTKNPGETCQKLIEEFALWK